MKTRTPKLLMLSLAVAGVLSACGGDDTAQANQSAAKPALTAVRGNLKELGLEARSLVVSGDAVAHAARLVPAEPWRLVFVDPPYRSDLATRSVLAIDPAKLAPDAVIVIEHDRHNAPPEALGSLLRTDHRRYGDTMVSFFEVPV